MGRTEGAIKSLYHRTLIALREPGDAQLSLVRAERWAPGPAGSFRPPRKLDVRSMLQLVTDSTCDLPPALLAQLSRACGANHHSFQQTPYLEGETIDEVTFYEKGPRTLGMIPKTSPAHARPARRHLPCGGQGRRPGPIAAYYQQTERHRQFGRTSQAMVQDEVQVEVFDSMAGSAGLGFMVWEAWQMSQAGAGLTEILARMRA